METFEDNGEKNPEMTTERGGRSQSSPNYATLEPGFVVANRYVVQSALGSGSMGSVYRALDQEINGTHVAIKILHRKFASKKHLKRFMKEARLMHQISHENVVRTYAFGTDGDLVFYTMEYLEGRSLAELIDSREISIDEVADLAIQICRGLEAIHMSGVIHRDLKPSNILVTSDRQVKIMDFGIARSEDSNITAHGEILGSAGYMAPEIWLGQSHTPSVDIYALGIILYEVACGEIPFNSSSPASLMRHHLDTEPIPPKEKNSEVPSWLSDLILSLLRKAPEERPKSVRHVINSITRVFESDGSEIDDGKQSGSKLRGLSPWVTVVCVVLSVVATYMATRSFSSDAGVVKEIQRERTVESPDPQTLAQLEETRAEAESLRGALEQAKQEAAALRKEVKAVKAQNIDLMNKAPASTQADPESRKQASRLVKDLAVAAKRPSVSAALVKLGTVAEAPLIESLSDNNTRLSAIALLGELKSEDSIPYLMLYLNSENSSVASAARKALRQIGSPIATRAIEAQVNRSRRQQELIREAVAKAKEEVESQLKVKSDSPSAKPNIDRILAERRRKVRQTIKRANDLYWAERYEDAAQEFAKAVELSPDNWEAQGGLGYALQAMGKNSEAIKHLREAVRLNPKDSDAQEVLRLLEELAKKSR